MTHTHLSAIFPLNYSKLNFASFRLSPEIDKKIGNSFAWYFSKHFPGVVAIWEKGYFWILSESNIEIPSHENWKKALEEIQAKASEKLGDRAYFLQWVGEPKINADVIAQLAVRILQIHCRFSSNKIFSQNKVEIKRECNFWAEVVEINNIVQPAISLTAKSAFLYSGNLEDFFTNHPYRNDPEELLLDLQVRDIESNSTANIVGINGTIGEQRERLLQEAKGAISKEKLRTASDEQPVVSIQFGKNSLTYDYAMAALRPCVTAKTASVFDLEYGELLKHTKISYQERQELLNIYKQEAHNILSFYGLQLKKQCIHNKQYPNLFWIPKTKLEDTLLLFGNGVTRKKSETLKGLFNGGVYHRHSEFENLNRKIRFAIINFTSLNEQSFFQELSKRLNNYKFQVLLPPENIISVSLNGFSPNEAKAKVIVQASVDEIMKLSPDIVLVFLLPSDRGRDDSNGNSFYCQVYNLLLRRQIASQFIYEKTLNQQYKHILNQVVPGILAKLGNLPFVLAESLSIADYFIGLDVSRKSKQKLPGSINACASLRLYGKRGEFIRYQLADDHITDGEEIPERILQNFLPLADLKNKRVLIYRDGIFRGDEIKHILEWGKAINAEFILVECLKSQIPRLYNLSDKKIQQPTRGLALRLTSREAILVTTQVSPNVGIPRPLRLKIREEGISASIETLVDTTLKLTLLHHGSLKDPRLPIPLFGADRIAYRRLQGIYPGALEGDKQYWL